MLIRPIEPDEYARLGALTLDAYTTLDGYRPEREYEEELADVRSRAEAVSTEVLVAIDDNGRLLGGVTYVADGDSPYAEFEERDTAGMRMLAVDAAVRRAGAGNALVEVCIDRARAAKRAQIVLHSTRWMTAAHALYERRGFVRDESLDWDVNPEIQLW